MIDFDLHNGGWNPSSDEVWLPLHVLPSSGASCWPGVEFRGRRRTRWLWHPDGRGCSVLLHRPWACSSVQRTVKNGIDLKTMKPFNKTLKLSAGQFLAITTYFQPLNLSSLQFPLFFRRIHQQDTRSLDWHGHKNGNLNFIKMKFFSLKTYVWFVQIDSVGKLFADLEEGMSGPIAEPVQDASEVKRWINIAVSECLVYRKLNLTLPKWSTVQLIYLSSLLLFAKTSFSFETRGYFTMEWEIVVIIIILLIIKLTHKI